MKYAFIVAGLSALFVQAAKADRVSTASGMLDIFPVVEDLDTPWAFGFLPDAAILITERDGRLLWIKGDQRHKVSGLPKVEADGQGGLLDVLVPRDFAATREIFLTYSKKQGVFWAGTAVFRATLSKDGRRLTRGRTIFEIKRGSRGGRHFGSRLIEARDGTLFVTIGDRGDRPEAQNLNSHNGSVLRITKDGQPAPGNPFVGLGLPEIWSFGHRNPQGAALDSQGQLWINEHGARGGDEVNRVRKGRNYGWPVIAYGRHYSGAKIGEGSEKEGLEQPEFYWDPSIAPSGMTFYDGEIAEWRGDAFVGSLKFDYISRLSGTPLKEVEQIQTSETARVRDVRQGPDGALWFLSVGNDALYRIAPTNSN